MKIYSKHKQHPLLYVTVPHRLEIVTKCALIRMAQEMGVKGHIAGQGRY